MPIFGNHFRTKGSTSVAAKVHKPRGNVDLRLTMVAMAGSKWLRSAEIIQILRAGFSGGGLLGG
jgi:hypothetical protein